MNKDYQNNVVVSSGLKNVIGPEITKRSFKCGQSTYLRTLVPVEKKDWAVKWEDYEPARAHFDFGNKPWADPDIGQVVFSCCRDEANNLVLQFAIGI